MKNEAKFLIAAQKKYIKFLHNNLKFTSEEEAKKASSLRIEIQRCLYNLEVETLKMKIDEKSKN